jgi:sugar lactone lactonase YvrE
MPISSLNPASSGSASGLAVARLCSGALAFALMSGSAHPATLYVTSPASKAISTVSMSGVVAPLTSFEDVHGAAVDVSGNLFVTSCKQVAGGTDSKVTEINMSGSFNTYATMYAGFFGAYGLDFDPSGNLYVAGFGNSRVFKVTPSGSTSIVASGASVLAPYDLACDSLGNVFVGNSGSNTIVKITPSGSVSTFATLANYCYGLAVDSSDNVYASIIGTGAILKITTSGSVSTFVSGLSGPRGLTFDTDGNLYTNNGSFDIVKISSSGSVSTFASSLPYAIEDVAFSPFAPVAVPEPSTCCMALAGLACGGYSLFRRRTQV